MVKDVRRATLEAFHFWTYSRAVDGVIAAVTEALKSDDQVTIIGFGTFLVRQREARSGRNPRTGETIQIKASKVPAFKAGKALKDAVN